MVCAFQGEREAEICGAALTAGQRSRRMCCAGGRGRVSGRKAAA